MIESLKKNKILLSVFVIVAVIFAWSMLSGGGTSTKTTSVLTSSSDSKRAVVDQNILKLLLDMRSIKLNGTVFKTPAFELLRDFGRTIVPEPIGRVNPFAPTATSTSIQPTAAEAVLFKK